MKINIIIPAYNEGERIYDVLNQIQNSLNFKPFLPAKALAKQVSFKLIVVDDGSSDNTFDQAARAGVKVLKHIANRGQGAALVTGTKYALKHGAEVIVHFDADGQHQVSDIGKLAEPIINKRVGVVLGSRFIKEPKSQKKVKLSNNLPTTISNLLSTKDIPLLRRFFILGNLIVNTFLTGVFLSDAHNGLRALSADAAKKINITQDRMAHATEYIQEINRLGLLYQEIPVTIRYGQNSKKSQGFFDGVKILKELFLGRLTK